MRPRPDAAENSIESPCNLGSPTGFNEAAARCRGKLPDARVAVLPGYRFNEAAARCRGKPRSCRPPGRRSGTGFNEAAARCRGKLDGHLSSRAAARPRFNEAAARCRGKHTPPRRGDGAVVASMRPRPDAAENGGRGRRPRTSRRCFNEAAARCRGKPGGRPDPARPPPGFNEAAARCRGKLPASRPVFAGRFEASMRPRPDAAENSRPTGRVVFRRQASMRPRPDAAENSLTLDPFRGHGRASMRPRPDAAENCRS